eukprot:scaffold129446_cov30-Phaeocystis_antarctica.AAC.1
MGGAANTAVDAGFRTLPLVPVPVPNPSPTPNPNPNPSPSPSPTPNPTPNPSQVDAGFLLSFLLLRLCVLPRVVRGRGSSPQP